MHRINFAEGCEVFRSLYCTFERKDDKSSRVIKGIALVERALAIAWKSHTYPLSLCLWVARKSNYAVVLASPIKPYQSHIRRNRREKGAGLKAPPSPWTPSADAIPTPRHAPTNRISCEWTSMRKWSPTFSILSTRPVNATLTLSTSAPPSSSASIRSSAPCGTLLWVLNLAG